MEETAIKLDNLRDTIKKSGTLLVSYSGGIDSTLLGVIAHEILGEKMKCAIIKSPLMQKSEFEHALNLAEQLKIPLTVLKSEILKDEAFTENTKERCYICKKFSAELLRKEAEKLGLKHIADGTNYSDTKVFRPGYKAGCEEGILHPFVEAKITKDEIREISRDYNLLNSDKPSASCLATRIPYNTKLSEDNLKKIEKAEEFIKKLGVSQLRVREFHKSARIEVTQDDMQLILKNRDEISEKLKSLGFLYITLDLDGFVSGSMDR